MLDRLIGVLDGTNKEDYHEAWEEKFLPWLKSIKDRVQPQQKQEWSEEDELRFKQAIYVCHRNGYTDVENWLKSLKPQPQWKPTREQMDLLGEVQQALLGKGCHNRFVNFMYDLKKL